MNPFHLIKNFRIRYKLLFIYSSIFMIIISMGSMIIYSTVKKTVTANIESELKNSTAAIQNMVRTAVSVSIKNHLRAAAEKNHDIIQHLYDQYQRGDLSELAAKQKAAEIILCQKVGTTGYICIIGKDGKTIKHPKLPEGQDLSMHGFVQEMIKTQNGYIEYYWKNPDEDKPMAKALYVMLFEPWDWLITVSSYREEFIKLVNVNDFKQSVLSLKFGKTGYAYVLDTTGNIIIHPKLEGTNLLATRDMPDQFFKEMLKRKNGKMIYSWKNPQERRFRKKLVLFNHIPEYDWIVASSSYLNEFYSPMETIRNFIVFISIASLVIFIPVTFVLSATITRPLRELMTRFNQDIMDGFSDRLVQMDSHDEVGQLTFYYNSFMDKLEKYSRDLQDQIRETQVAQEALKINEEKYRSVMEATPDPIIVYDMKGLVTYLNPAFTNVFGWSLDECTGRKMDHFVPEDHWDETHKGIQAMTSGLMLPITETRRLTKAGKLIDVSIRGSVYCDETGEMLGSVVTHRDVSELKRLEKQIMETGEIERRKIGHDLHDDLCPHLIGIEGLSKVLYRKLDSNDPSAAALTSQITELIKEATIKTRQLARGLCPVYFNHGLESSLEELVANIQNLFRVNCSLSIDAPSDIDNHLIITHLYHIAQEAAHNAIKHGQADRVEIRMTGTRDKGLALTVSDNGRGFDPDRASDGMGLRIMQHRAKMIDCSFSIRSQLSSQDSLFSTRVCVELPATIASAEYK
ncbi:MAG: PAS domain S-box protein [Desulfobacteraceae bacterium]|nr:MAG: PAS domain S-box protein [Desulfobacteraceae bacterium]